MSTLSAERCVACRRDSPQVTEAEIAELTREVPEWRLLERDGPSRARRADGPAAEGRPRVGAAPVGPGGCSPQPRQVTVR
jgi:hypothetical protein